MKSKITILCMISTLLVLTSCGASDTQKKDVDRMPSLKSTGATVTQSTSPSQSNKKEVTPISSDDIGTSSESTASVASGSDNSEQTSSGSDTQAMNPLYEDTGSGTSEVITEEDGSGILAAFQTQYSNKDPEVQKTMTLETISLQDGKFFKGLVKFGGRSIDNVFAIKKGDTWKILSFGTDTPDCKWLASLPAEMSTGCVSETQSGMLSSTGESIQISQ